MRWASAAALLSCCLLPLGSEANAKHPVRGATNATSTSSSDAAFGYFDGPYSGGAATASAGLLKAQATLANLTMNCIITNVYVYKAQDMIGRSTPQLYGDAFVRIAPTIANNAAPDAVMNAIAALPEGRSMPINAMYLDGVNIWLLGLIAQQTGLNISYHIGRLPASFNSRTDDVNSTLYALYNFETPYDCVVSSTTRNRHVLSKYTRELSPHFSAGFQVVTLVPAFMTAGLIDRAFLWTKPFGGNLWAVLAATVVFSGVFIMLIESTNPKAEYSKEKTLFGRLQRAVHIGVLAVAGKGFYNPESAPGRWYAAGYSMTVFVLVAAYIANSAAILSVPPVMVQTVTSINSFGDSPNKFPTYGRRLICCALNRTADLTFLAQSYPSVPVYVVNDNNNVGVSALFPFIANGTCDGAVATDAELAFALNEYGDPRGNWCGLQTVGASLSFVIQSVPITVDTSIFSDDAINSIGFAVNQAVVLGNFSNYFTANDLTEPRSVCLRLANAAASGAPQLSQAIDLEDLVGIFAIQGIGLVLGVIAYVGKKSTKLAKRIKVRRAERLSGGQSSGGRSPDGGSETATPKAHPISPSGSASGTASMLNDVEEALSGQLAEEKEELRMLSERFRKESDTMLTIKAELESDRKTTESFYREAERQLGRKIVPTPGGAAGVAHAEWEERHQLQLHYEQQQQLKKQQAKQQAKQQKQQQAKQQEQYPQPQQQQQQEQQRQLLQQQMMNDFGGELQRPSPIRTS